MHSTAVVTAVIIIVIINDGVDDDDVTNDSILLKTEDRAREGVEETKREREIGQNKPIYVPTLE